MYFWIKIVVVKNFTCLHHFGLAGANIDDVFR